MRACVRAHTASCSVAADIVGRGAQGLAADQGSRIAFVARVPLAFGGM